MATRVDPLSGVIPSDQKIDLSRIRIAAVVTIAATVVGNLIIYALTAALTTIPDDFMPLATVGPTIFASVIYMLPAIGAFWFIARRMTRPVETYRVVASVALLLSYALLLIPASEDTATGAVLLALSVMHVVGFLTATLILPFMTRRTAR